MLVIYQLPSPAEGIEKDLKKKFRFYVASLMQNKSEKSIIITFFVTILGDLRVLFCKCH